MALLPEYTDEYTRNHFGIGLAQYLAQNPDAAAQKQQQDQAAQQQAQAYQQQQDYKAATDQAITQLQGQGTSLDQQYQGLLNSIMGTQQTNALNGVTVGENNLLASRGITNNSPLYSQQMSMAQLPVRAQYQGMGSSLAYTEAQLQNTLASNIAALRTGAAGTSAELPLSYGSLQLAQAANIANIGLLNAQAQQAQTGARYVSTPFGPYDTQTNQYVSGIGNAGIVTIGGKPYVNVPDNTNTSNNSTSQTNINNNAGKGVPVSMSNYNPYANYS